MPTNPHARFTPCSLPAILLAAAAFAGSATMAIAEQSPAVRIGDRPQTDAEIINEHFNLSGHTLLQLEFDAAVGQPLMVGVPIGGDVYTVDLQPHSVRSADYQLLLQVEDGSLIPAEAGPERTLRGVAIEAPGSFVGGSLLHNGLHLQIKLPDVEGRYWVAPVAAAIPGAEAGDYLLYHDADRIEVGGCGVDEQFLADQQVDDQSGGGVAGGGVAGDEMETCVWKAQIACDSDYEYYLDNNQNVANIEAKISNIINTMNEQYERDVNISHEIVTIIVRTTVNDPYSSTTNAGNLLNEFRNYWNATQQAIARDVAHLFTGRNISGDVIGIAYQGAICNTNAYGVVEDINGLSYQTDLSAHELGHNWSANHCTCPQNTMNASLGAIAYNEFHPNFTVPEIVSYRISRSFCLNFFCVPNNDNCPDPWLIIGEQIWSFDNTNATTDGPDEQGACDESGFSQIENDVWYWYFSQCDGQSTVSLCGSDFDTKLAVYGALCPEGPGELLYCNDDSAECGTGSVVTFPSVDGGIYRIRAGGASGENGVGIIAVTCEPGLICPSDTNGDGTTDVTDLVSVISDWGTDGGANNTDINGDGVVDVTDLVSVISNWGSCS